MAFNSNHGPLPPHINRTDLSFSFLTFERKYSLEHGRTDATTPMLRNKSPHLRNHHVEQEDLPFSHQVGSKP